MNSSKTNQSISERIRKLRIQKGMSQKEFAELVNLHPVQYNRYEKGETLPSTETLNKLANALGVSVDYIYDGKEQDAAVANLEDEELLKLFVETEKLEFEDKEVVKKLLNAFLMKKRLQKELVS